MPVYERGPSGKDIHSNSRRMSADPGYRGVLPRVFPYRWRGSREDAALMVDYILEVEHTGFALTEHPSFNEGNVDLWLSAKVCEYLIDTFYLKREHLEVT